MQIIKEATVKAKVPMVWYGMKADAELRLLNKDIAGTYTPIISVMAVINIAKDDVIIYPNGDSGPFDPGKINAEDLTFDALNNPDIMRGVKSIVKSNIAHSSEIDTMAIIPTIVIQWGSDKGDRLKNTPNIHVVSRYPFIAAAATGPQGAQIVTLPGEAGFVQHAGPMLFNGVMKGITSRNPHFPSNLTALYKLLYNTHGNQNANELGRLAQNEYVDTVSLYGEIKDGIAGDKMLRRIGTSTENGNISIDDNKEPRFYVHELMRPTNCAVVAFAESEGNRTISLTSEIPTSGCKTIVVTPFSDDNVTGVMGGYYTSAIIDDVVEEERASYKDFVQTANRSNRSTAGRNTISRPGRNQNQNQNQQNQGRNTVNIGVSTRNAAASIPQRNQAPGNRSTGRGNLRGSMNQNMNQPVNNTVLKFEPVSNSVFIQYPRLNSSIRPV